MEACGCKITTPRYACNLAPGHFKRANLCRAKKKQKRKQGVPLQSLRGGVLLHSHPSAFHKVGSRLQTLCAKPRLGALTEKLRLRCRKYSISPGLARLPGFQVTRKWGRSSCFLRQSIAVSSPLPRGAPGAMHGHLPRAIKIGQNRGSDQPAVSRRC